MRAQSRASSRPTVLRAVQSLLDPALGIEFHNQIVTRIHKPQIVLRIETYAVWHAENRRAFAKEPMKSPSAENSSMG